MKVAFTTQGWDEYDSWLAEDKKILRKINQLIKEAKRDPGAGTGKPEPLKGDLSGCCRAASGRSIGWSTRCRPQFRWRSRYWSFLLKLDPDRPSPTIQAQPGPNVGPSTGTASGQRASTLSSLSLIVSRSSLLFQSTLPAFWSAVRTAAGVAVGLWALYRAAAPATCGDAIDVPLMVL